MIFLESQQSERFLISDEETEVRRVQLKRPLSPGSECVRRSAGPLSPEQRPCRLSSTCLAFHQPGTLNASLVATRPSGCPHASKGEA